MISVNYVFVWAAGVKREADKLGAQGRGKPEQGENVGGMSHQWQRFEGEVGPYKRAANGR